MNSTVKKLLKSGNNPNELAVIFVGGSGDTFRRRAEQFCSHVAGSEFNFASLAYISDKGSETVEEVIDKARRKSAFGWHL